MQIYIIYVYIEREREREREIGRANIQTDVSWRAGPFPRPIFLRRSGDDSAQPTLLYYTILYYTMLCYASGQDLIARSGSPLSHLSVASRDVILCSVASRRCV